MAVGVLVSVPALSQDGKQEATGDKPNNGEMSEEAMAAMMAMMMPGEAHAKLAKLAGEWTTKTKMTMPGAPPGEETEGTSKFVVVLGGRFLHEEHQGTMMGQPFQSATLLGYNNGSKKYEGVWTYTMGTSMLTMSGTSADGGKTIKLDATWDNESGVRETTTIKYIFADDDHFTIMMISNETSDGSAAHEMEIQYTRKK